MFSESNNSITHLDDVLKKIIFEANSEDCKTYFDKNKPIQDINALSAEINSYIQKAIRWVQESTSLQGVMQTLTILIENGIILSRNSLSNSPEFLLGRLIIEKPDYALELLKKISPVQLSKDTKEVTNSSSTLQTVRPIIFPTKSQFLGIRDEDTESFIECIKYLKKENIDFKYDLLLMKALLQHDHAIAIKELSNDFNMSPVRENEKPSELDEFLNNIMHWDSVETFKLWYEHWQVNNTLNEQYKKVFSLENLLKMASKNHAYKCVRTLLKLLKDDTTNDQDKILDELRKQAVIDGDCLMLLTLCKSQTEIAAQLIYNSISHKELEINSRKYLFQFRTEDSIWQENARFCILRMLRFSPLATVDEVFDEMLKIQSKRREALAKIYAETKKEFLSYAPFFSRYASANDLKEIETVYKNRSKTSEVTKHVIEDLEYGRSRYQLTTRLLKTLSTPKNFPAHPDIALLPKSTTGKMMVAFIMEAVVNLNIQRMKKINPRDVDIFSKMRDHDDYATSITGTRYEFAAPLVSSVYYYSTAQDVAKRNDFSHTIYTNLYNNTETTNNLPVCVTRCTTTSVLWSHGKQLPKDNWRCIEDLFEKAWNLNLRKPNPANNNETLFDEDKLTEFYAIVAELVGLIGDTQPLARGSGSVAEIVLAISHMHHGLQPPILKLEYPQLDVLDITFPLSDYKTFFPHFFEPETVPKHLTTERLNNIPLFYQMQGLYEAKHNKEAGMTVKPSDATNESEMIVIKPAMMNCSHHILSA